MAAVQQIYAAWKVKALGLKIIGNGECVALVVNNSNAYIEALFPGVSWTSIIPPLAPPNDGAKFMANKGNKYLQWVANDHNNPNQVPPQGAIGVFDATPAPGYSNTFNNPDGHTGVFDSASPAGYSLLQQNAPIPRAHVNITHYAWKFRPCMGWYIPIMPSHPIPVSPHNAVTLPKTTGPWHLYRLGGPYNPSNSADVIVTFAAGTDRTFPIVNPLGDGLLVVNTPEGQGVLYTKGSDVIIK